MPMVVVLITVIAIIAGTAMLSSIAKSYFKHVGEHGGDNEKSSSLTSSELEIMLRRVVEEVNAPLLAKIEGIEQQLSISGERDVAATETKSLPPLVNKPLLEDLDAPRDLAAIANKKSHTV